MQHIQIKSLVTTDSVGVLLKLLELFVYLENCCQHFIYPNLPILGINENSV